MCMCVCIHLYPCMYWVLLTCYVYFLVSDVKKNACRDLSPYKMWSSLYIVPRSDTEEEIEEEYVRKVIIPYITVHMVNCNISVFRYTTAVEHTLNWPSL